MLFNSGFDANLAVFGTLPNKESIVFIDEHIHASVRTGLRIAGCQYFKFKHNDFNHLKELLNLWAEPNVECWVGIEGTYSMDGDIPDAEALKQLKEQYDFQLIVDEAHSWGLLGESGKGWSSQFEVENLCAIRVFPFGKTLGLFGAAIAGDEYLISFLQNCAPSFIFSTALPEAWAKHALRNLDLLKNAQEERNKLNQLIQETQNLFEINSLPVTQTAIQAVFVQGNENVLNLANYLRTSGINALGIRYPTVPLGKERIRIILHSYNSIDDVKILIELINNFLYDSEK